MSIPPERLARARELMAAVQANHARLRGCPGHDFSLDTTPDRPIGKTWACSRCGGTVDSVAKGWYEHGRAHEAAAQEAAAREAAARVATAHGEPAP